MRGRETILSILFCALSLSLVGQSVPSFQEHPLSPFLIQNSQESRFSTDAASFNAYDKIIERLEKARRRKTDEDRFLRSIFYKVHRNNLVSYERVATMQETLASGEFGCLSGTALYALILGHFGYEYEIIEMPNHVFLQVHVGDNTYAFESTSSEYGFERLDVPITHTTKPQGFFNRNMNSQLTVGENTRPYQTFTETPTSISLEQLAGLQYFNEAVKLFVKKEFTKSMDMAFEAYRFYPSERNEELMQLIINKILTYEVIKEDIKNRYLDRYIKSVKKKKISQTK